MENQRQYDHEFYLIAVTLDWESGKVYESKR